MLCPMTPAAQDLSPIAPLRQPVFRMLWTTWLVANVCMWMNDVAAAWMMTSLTTTPAWVALVQTAATLPVFLLGLPSGALADGRDRKRYFLATQLWIALVAALLCGVVFLGHVTPGVLLALTFANGIGLAMRWPVFAAIVPELVPRAQLPAALALNGVSMNASRIIGPLVAGALIASAGSAWVFLLNAVLSLVAAVIISRWQREHRPSPLGREKLTTAMRVGWQFVAQSAQLKGVLVRIGLFFFHSTALMALLALVARGFDGGGASTFTVLLASMGAGAIASSVWLPKLRARCTRDQLVQGGAALNALTMAAMAFIHTEWLAVPVMFLGGASWLTTANSLSVAMQTGLPDWVRARGMSIYQMTIMGGSAAGAALWGQVATWTSLQACLLTAAGSALLTMWLAVRLSPDNGQVPDLSPHRILAVPATDAPPPAGQILVTIEYQVSPERADDFRALMLAEGRSSRLRNGALSWELLHDVNEPGRFVETIVDESWTDHLRRFDRFSTSDQTLRERRLAFHTGATPPVVRRHLMESTVRAAHGTPGGA
jgi:MFS family permease/quinol monooxygenase YgiN